MLNGRITRSLALVKNQRMSPDLAPFVSVVIPTHSRPDGLRNCLQSLGRSTYPFNKFEVVVVDDGGSPQAEIVTGSLDTPYTLLVQRQMNAGPAVARNNGAKVSSGEILLFVDDDCVPQPDWISAMVQAFSNGDDVLVGGKTVNGLEENIFSAASQALLEFVTDYFITKGSSRRFFASCNIGMNAQSFLEIGGFNEAFGLAAGEDRDFSRRWIRSNRELQFVSTAVVFHYHTMGLRSYLKQHYNYGQGANQYRKQTLGAAGEENGLEPLRFYSSLVLSPWSTSFPKKFRLSLLLLVSQIAGAIGYFVQRLSDSDH